MIKDFSEDAYNELISLVQEVKSEQLCAVTDWIGDRWYDFTEFFGILSIENSLDNVSAYHKKVIDKNNAGEEQIETIFENVSIVENSYVTRFAAVLARVDGFMSLMKDVTSVISPTSSDFTAANIKEKLDRIFLDYTEMNTVLNLLGEDQITESSTDDNTILKMGKKIVPYILAVMPNVTTDQKVEIPIGPDMIAYYEVEVNVDTNGKYDATVVIDEQRASLSEISVTGSGRYGELTGSVDGENASIEASTDNASVKIDTEGKFEGQSSYKMNNTEYSAGYKLGIGELDIYYSAETEVEGGSVKSTVGVRKIKDSDSSRKWIPLPAPEPVPASSPVNVFENIRIDPKEAAKVATVVTVVAVVAGLALIPFTGGASAALCLI